MGKGDVGASGQVNQQREHFQSMQDAQQTRTSNMISIGGNGTTTNNNQSSRQQKMLASSVVAQSMIQPPNIVNYSNYKMPNGGKPELYGKLQLPEIMHQ